MAITHGDYARNWMADQLLGRLNVDHSAEAASWTVRGVAPGGGATENVVGVNHGWLRVLDSTRNAADGGAGVAYASGSPESPNEGRNDYFQIALLAMSNPAFQPAGDDLIDDDGSTVITEGVIATAIASDITPDEYCRAGTANWFEFVDGKGQMIVQGNILVQSHEPEDEIDIALTSTGIAADDTIAIRNLSYTAAP